MEKFGEFAQDEDSRLEGDKLNISELFNKEIVITAYRLMPSKAVKGKQCLQIQFQYPGGDDMYIAFTNSEVIIRQLTQYKDHIPFLTTVRKRGSYYTLS